MNTITLRELINHVYSGEPFKMSYVTLDLKRKKGGEIKEVAEAIGMKVPSDDELRESLKREPTQDEARRLELARLTHRKNPEHRRNFTINYQVLQDGHPTSIIRKFHPSLTLTFNEKIVTP